MYFEIIDKKTGHIVHECKDLEQVQMVCLNLFANNENIREMDLSMEQPELAPLNSYSMITTILNRAGLKLRLVE